MKTGPRLNLWIAAGWLLFLCSLLLPAHSGSNQPASNTILEIRGSSPLPDNNQIQIGIPRLSGWEAMRFAFDGKGYAVASATTNLLVVLTILAPWSRRFASRFCWVIAAAVPFNLWWIFALGEDSRGLTVGYFVWLASYALIAYGLLRLGQGPSNPNRITESPV